MHKKLLMGLATLALGLGLVAPAARATSKPMHGTQLAQADTGADQKTTKSKKKHHKKKHKDSKKGATTQPQ